MPTNNHQNLLKHGARTVVRNAIFSYEWQGQRIRILCGPSKVYTSYYGYMTMYECKALTYRDAHTWCTYLNIIYHWHISLFLWHVLQHNVVLAFERVETETLCTSDSNRPSLPHGSIFMNAIRVCTTVQWWINYHVLGDCTYQIFYRALSVVTSLYPSVET